LSKILAGKKIHLLKSNYLGMKLLPIGIQHFEPLIQKQYIYVDKTKLIYRLVKGGGAYFLSRPRRFGKSLLVDTLRHIFLGNQHLFKDLWIYDKIEWQTHPIIHLDFSTLSYQQKGLEAALCKKLRKIGKTYEVTLEGDDAKELLEDLIEQLSKETPVALLIDEYDKPIIDYITDLPKANHNLNILREFYSGLKALGDKLSILFITGIAKFSKVSLFSVLNHLTDLTLHKDYAALTGITQTELQLYFGGYIQQAANQFKVSETQLIAQLKTMYDGYSWDGKTFVYNPFSLLHFFDERSFKNYWFSTGTPNFLVQLLRSNRMRTDALEQQIVSDSFFETFDIRYGIDVYLLLFQAGYLTVTELKETVEEVQYTIGYPNKEVQQSLLRNLIQAFTFKEATIVHTALLELEKAFQNRQVKEITQQLNVLFSDMSYLFYPLEKKEKKQERVQQEFIAWEGWFHTVIYLVLQFMSIRIDCEITKHEGRIDAIVQVPNYLYIIEFKLSDATTALTQIKDRKYAHSYRNSSKEVILMGIAFNKKKRVVEDIEWEVWDRA